MKTAIRLAVAALVLTGFAATTQASSTSKTTLSAKVSSMPIPVCAPDGTTSCGMGDKGN